MGRRWAGWAGAALALAAVGMAAACGGGAEQDGAGAGVAVSGVGRVSAAPDVAVVQLGADATAESVAEARGRSAEAMTAIRASLAGNGVEDRDVRTQSFDIYPRFEYPGGEQRLVGFEVSNRVSVRIRDLARVSAILDEAITAGGDAIRVSGVSFEVDDPAPLAEEARRLAVEDARAKARQLADLAGVGLGEARTIAESGGASPPPQPAFAEARVAAAPDAAASTPVAPGEGEIAVSVYVVYAIE